jgi:nitrile hydratase beta subunit
MNGVHDMGGMHGMGPIEHEQNEPVFHAAWEGRVYALTRVLRGVNWNLDALRHGIELLPPAEYLRMTYYERWFARLLAQLAASGDVTRAEIESGVPTPGSATRTPAVTGATVAPATLFVRAPSRRNVPVAAQFKVEQKVRARNIHPPGHTRLPRYVRGRIGVIAVDRGVFLFPDTNAHHLGEKPQHLYSVRFAARELWGDQASPRDSIFLDMWDDYLERI